MVARTWGVAFLVLVTSCGGGSKPARDDPGPTTQVAGRVLVPAPAAAPKIAFGRLYPSPVVPVAGAVVEAWPCGDDGVEIGAVALATATSDASGSFQLAVPDSNPPGPKLLVRTAQPTGLLRAQAVDRYVDLGPLSDLVLDTLTNLGHTLANVSIPDVMLLRNYVEEADLSTELGTGDVSATRDALRARFDADVGYQRLLVETQSGSGDAGPFAGTMNNAELGVYTVAFEPPRFAYANTTLDAGHIAFTADTGGAFHLGASTFHEREVFMAAQPNGPGVQYGPLGVSEDESSSPTGEPGLVFRADSAGRGRIFLPFSEEICEQGSDCEGSGFRYQALGIGWYPLFAGGGADGAYVASYRNYSARYGLDAGGAIDLDAGEGVIHTYWLELLLKEHAVANTAVDGARYGLIEMGTRMTNGGVKAAFANRLDLTMAATTATDGTATFGTGTSFELDRAPVGAATGASVAWTTVGADLNTPVGTAIVAVPQPYRLDVTTGGITLSPDGPAAGRRMLHLGRGGALVLHPDYDTTWNAGNPSQADTAWRSLTVGIRLGTANPTVAGQSYRVFWLQRGYTESGASTIQRAPSAAVAFTAGGAMQATGTLARMLRPNDIATGPDAIKSDLVADTAIGIWTYDDGAAEGSLRFTLVDGGGGLRYFEGWMAADGEVGVFRVWTSALTGTGGGTGDASVGLAILVRE